MVEPNLIRTPRDAEEAACRWMKAHGFIDASLTSVGSDGGVDIRSHRAVAQVKAAVRPIGRPVVQQLAGIARVENREALFFSLGGFTSQAVAWAVQGNVALFEFDLVGDIRPICGRARQLAVRSLEKSSEEELPEHFDAISEVLDVLDARLSGLPESKVFDIRSLYASAREWEQLAELLNAIKSHYVGSFVEGHPDKSVEHEVSSWTISHEGGGRGGGSAWRIQISPSACLRERLSEVRESVAGRYEFAESYDAGSLVWTATVRRVGQAIDFLASVIAIEGVESDAFKLDHSFAKELSPGTGLMFPEVVISSVEDIVVFMRLLCGYEEQTMLYGYWREDCDSGSCDTTTGVLAVSPEFNVWNDYLSELGWRFGIETQVSVDTQHDSLDPGWRRSMPVLSHPGPDEKAITWSVTGVLLSDLASRITEVMESFGWSLEYFSFEEDYVDPESVSSKHRKAISGGAIDDYDSKV